MPAWHDIVKLTRVCSHFYDTVYQPATHLLDDRCGAMLHYTTNASFLTDDGRSIHMSTADRLPRSLVNMIREEGFGFSDNDSQLAEEIGGRANGVVLDASLSVGRSVAQFALHLLQFINAKPLPQPQFL